MTRIVAIVTDPATARSCLDAAVTAAAAIAETRLEVLHPRLRPGSLILPSEEVMTAPRRAELVAALAATSRALRQVAEEAAGAAAEIAWTEVEGDSVAAVVAEHGTAADLIVLGRPTEPEGEAALHAAIFATGRLLLLAPPADGAATPRFGRHLAIAWNGGEQVGRAVTAAMPWLARAARVSLLLVPEGGRGAEMADEGLALLRRRGVAAEVRLLDPGGAGRGDRLLAEAHAIGADGLVMGAYRHNRLLELILGGVTRRMLEIADLPLCLMH